MASDPSYANAISSIESGGKYDILGPQTKSGDQAYGKYQIMGANIPQWSKEILGQELTPQEFLANPQAQDAIFQGKFGQYVDKYGPEGAAQAWIGGPGGVGKVDRKDSLGTSIGAYGQKFMAALGPQGAAQNAPTASPVPSFNQPPQQTASLPAYGWSPGQQQPAQSSFQPAAGAMSPAAPTSTSPPQMNMPQAAMPGVLRPKVDPSQLLALLSNAPASVRALYSRG